MQGLCKPALIGIVGDGVGGVPPSTIEHDGPKERSSQHLISLVSHVLSSSADDLRQCPLGQRGDLPRVHVGDRAEADDPDHPMKIPGQDGVVVICAEELFMTVPFGRPHLSSECKRMDSSFRVRKFDLSSHDTVMCGVDGQAGSEDRSTIDWVRWLRRPRSLRACIEIGTKGQPGSAAHDVAMAHPAPGSLGRRKHRRLRPQPRIQRELRGDPHANFREVWMAWIENEVGLRWDNRGWYA